MCLISFAYKCHPGYRLVLAANRDEFLDRPTASLGFHFPGETILAGRDLRSGGTWLGLAGDGRLAAITNYRDPSRVNGTAPSRGEIILEYLRSGLQAEAFLKEFTVRSERFNGFNLLLADNEHLVHYSNISHTRTILNPGIYGLSNQLLDTPWPKVIRAKQLLCDLLAQNGTIDREPFFHLLTDRTRPDDTQLPNTGIGLEWERLLSPIFIHSPTYGTRSSSLLTITDNGQADFHERSYCHNDGFHISGEQRYRLDVQTWADRD